MSYVFVRVVHHNRTLSACLYLNLKHGNLDHSATTAGWLPLLYIILYLRKHGLLSFMFSVAKIIVLKFKLF